jgi:hypothetical protein
MSRRFLRSTALTLALVSPLVLAACDPGPETCQNVSADDLARIAFQLDKLTAPPAYPFTHRALTDIVFEGATGTTVRCSATLLSTPERPLPDIGLKDLQTRLTFTIQPIQNSDKVWINVLALKHLNFFGLFI